ncbi:MAG: hypothetical protein AAF721_26210 [Myxococcota bacterium]
MALRSLWLAVLAISMLSVGFRYEATSPAATDPDDQTDMLGDGARLIVVDAAGEPDVRRARVLAPGEAASLAVRLLDGNGAPVPAARLRFLAPDQPARGGFEEADGDHVRAAVTDEDGTAAATFIATEEGLFSIDVHVDDSRLLASFAISSWASPPTPSVPLDEIDAAVPAAVAEVLTDESLVHGPFLLPALTTISIAGAEEPIEATYAPSWFYWVDHVPFAMYEHPTTLVSLHGQPDAEPETCGGRFTRVDGGKWPELVLPDGTPESLLNPVESNLRTRPASAKLGRVDAPTTFRANADDCAVVLNGKDFAGGAEPVAAFYRDVYGAGWVESRTLQDAVSDWKGLLSQASQRGCGKLILHMTGHGLPWPARPNIQLTKTDFVYYDNLADELEKHFGNSDVELQIYLSTCFAERMIAELQGHGLQGDVFASSSWWQSSWASDDIDDMFREMMDAWGELDAPTLATVFDHVVAAVEAAPAPPDRRDEAHYLRRMSPQRAALDPGYQDWDVPDLDLKAVGSTRLQLARPPSNTYDAPDGRAFPMQLDITTPSMSKFRLRTPSTGSAHRPRIGADEGGVGLDVTVNPPADTGFEGTYTVTSRSKYAAYRGTGAVRFADPGPPPPPEIVCTERKETIKLISETTLDPAMGITTHTSVPTLNDEHEILVWGGLGQPRYDILNPRCQSQCDEESDSIAIADPQRVVPLPSGETPLLTDAAYPRRLTDGRAFAFSAWLGGDQHAIISYRKGRYDVLATFTGADARARFTNHLRVSSKGGVLWGTHDEAILSDDSIASQSLFRFTGDCAEWVAEAGFAMPGTAWQYSRLYPEAILGDNTVLYTAAADDESGVQRAEGLYRFVDGDDVDPIVYLSGDPAPGGGTITSVDFAGATDDGAIVAWLGIRNGDEFRHALVRREKDGKFTELLANAGLAPLLPIDPARTATVTETFVGLDGQVAVIATLDSADAPYQRVGSVLYMEERGEMKVAAQEGEPQCGGPWVWSGLVDNDVKVWRTGIGTAYVRAYSRPVDGGASELALFRWTRGAFEKVLVAGPEGVVVNGSEHRTVTDFGVAAAIDAGTVREGEQHLSTNFWGELVLDVHYPPDTNGYPRRGLWLIRG